MKNHTVNYSKTNPNTYRTSLERNRRMFNKVFLEKYHIIFFQVKCEIFCCVFVIIYMSGIVDIECIHQIFSTPGVIKLVYLSTSLNFLLITKDATVN